MTLPQWPPRDWRALLALVASIAGAAVLTVFAAWVVNIIWRGGWHGFEQQRLDALAKALFGLLAIIGIVLVSLGLAINKRSVKGSAFGASFEAAGGDDDPVPAAAQAVADSAQSTADTIKGENGNG